MIVNVDSMLSKKYDLLLILISFLVGAGCSTPNPVPVDPQKTEAAPSATVPTQTLSPTHTEQVPPETEGSPTQTPAPPPTATEMVFEVGEELTIPYLRAIEIVGSEIVFEERLSNRSNYARHLVHYGSEGNKIYGLLTIPLGDPPEGGYKAIVFNHGYIPPAAYQTTERYNTYVDVLARNGFVVFKIDYRGHGESEGEPTGTYFSPAYTIDAIAALKSLQKLDIVDPQGIGMWGHSMAGNLVLRAMLIEPDIQAGVIWAGAVYSYEDFLQYGIEDYSYQPPPTPESEDDPDIRRRSRAILETHGRPDLRNKYWQAVSLTENIQYLDRPLQLHHAENDSVVNPAYSFNLVEVLKKAGKEYELYTYEGGGHNLISPYFDQAMLRTVNFFRENL